MTLGEGGGVDVSSGSSFTMNAGEIRNNRVLGIGPEKDAQGNGGGIFVDKDAVFTFCNGSIFQNSALSWGGGIYVNGSATMYGGEIRSNSARNGGAGINVGAGGVCVMKGGLLSSNVTGGYGGAVMVMEDGEFVFADGLAVNNQAIKGGKVFMIDGKAAISGGCIRGFTEAERERFFKKLQSGAVTGSSTTDCVIALAENGFLTISGGELYGPIGMVKQGQLVDTREQNGYRQIWRR
jgi:hypothetical protein